jgi:hypothetical protein
MRTQLTLLTLILSLACGGDDGLIGGSTLPSPDMTKVTYGVDPSTAASTTLVAGAAGTFPQNALPLTVRAETPTQAVETQVNDEGGFLVSLPATGFGTVVTLRGSDSSGNTGPAETLNVLTSASAPGEPQEVFAEPAGAGQFRIGAAFPGTTQLELVIVSAHGTVSLRVPTTLDGEFQHASAVVEASVGDVFFIYGWNDNLRVPGPVEDVEISF